MRMEVSRLWLSADQGGLHSKYITSGPFRSLSLTFVALSRGQEIVQLLSRQYHIHSRIRFCLVSLISRPITSHTLSAYHQAIQSLLFPPPLNLCLEHPGHTYPRPRANLPEPDVQSSPPPIGSPRTPEWPAHTLPHPQRKTSSQNACRPGLSPRPIFTHSPFPFSASPSSDLTLPALVAPGTRRPAGSLPFFSLLLVCPVSGPSWGGPPPISYPPLLLNSAASSVVICSLFHRYRSRLFLSCASPLTYRTQKVDKLHKPSNLAPSQSFDTLLTCCPTPLSGAPRLIAVIRNTS